MEKGKRSRMLNYTTYCVLYQQKATRVAHVYVCVLYIKVLV